MRKLFLFIILGTVILPTVHIHAQSKGADSMCINQSELRLVSLINQYRVQNKLAEIPLSKSLCFVAKTHVYDLQVNRPDTSICNTTSWSDKGKWSSCCFNKYVVTTECMWDKPKELTLYKFKGYEISYFEEGIVNEDSLFVLWTSTGEVIDMLLGKGIHSDKKWLAIGVGISDNYACIWLGQRPDPQGKPSICKNDTQAVISSTSSQKSDGKTGKYYLIYGSFSRQPEAEEEVKKYKLAGLKNAQIILNGDKIRVALGVYDGIKEAMAAKDKYKDKYKDAWILKN
ncbi:MAG: SPOR domain-containing protein [Bacteroidales bacterium]|nr:SPOR domain-containing protein [Bacteroidales bacterium]